MVGNDVAAATGEAGSMTSTEQFMSLFRGSEAGYGWYVELQAGDKRVKTISGSTPTQAWTDHLNGTGPGLGQIPICEGNVCWFGAIDVDDRGVSHAGLAKQLKRAGFPFIVCRSKSGGAHIYLFLKEPVDAGLVHDVLRDVADMLKVRNPKDREIEIFPKQRALPSGGFGNWINLPYYRADATNRYAVDAEGSQLTLSEFAAHAERLRMSREELERCRNPFSQDGPPCLRRLHCMGIENGSRNEALFNVGVNFKLSTPDDWENQLREYNAAHVDEPLRESEISSLITSLNKKDYSYKCAGPPIHALCERRKCGTKKFGIEATYKHGDTVPASGFTDLQNAERFALEHGEDLRYCRGLMSWLIYDGRRWRRDETGRIDLIAQDHAKAVMNQVVSDLANASGADHEKATKRVRAALQLQQKSRLVSMVEMARVRPPIATGVDALDRNPMLLNCENGTLDLATGRLREHRKEDLITRALPTPFDADARAPRWERFIDEITCGDDGFAAFLQRAVGVSLSGKTADQKIFLCVGTGANGKSVFLESIRELLGDYAVTVSATTFLHTQHGGVGGAPRSDLVKLAGKRFACASEVTEGRRLDEQLVKNVTGGEQITARGVYAAQDVEFTPQFKLWMAMNQTPDVFGEDEGIWRRLRVLPFDFKVTEKDKDPELLERLRSERSGILAWAVRGYGLWQANGGVGTCDRVDKASAGYRIDQDVLRDFLDECIEDDPKGTITGGELMQAYGAWCQEKRIIPMGQRALTRKLKAKNWEQADTRKGRPWVGKCFRAGREPRF